jgi:hypothetical protein
MNKIEWNETLVAAQQYSSIDLLHVARYCQVLLVSLGIVRYGEGSEKYLDGSAPNGDFPVLDSIVCLYYKIIKTIVSDDRKWRS